MDNKRIEKDVFNVLKELKKLRNFKKVKQVFTHRHYKDDLDFRYDIGDFDSWDEYDRPDHRHFTVFGRSWGRNWYIDVEDLDRKKRYLSKEGFPRSPGGKLRITSKTKVSDIKKFLQKHIK